MASNVNPPAAPIAVTPVITPVAAAITAYTSEGWTVLDMTKKKSMYNLVAYRTMLRGAPQYHFVTVVTEDEFKGKSAEEKNQFVQNAFSNNAVPVYYIVGSGGKSTRICPNDGKSIRIKALRKGGAVPSQDDSVLPKAPILPQSNKKATTEQQPSSRQSKPKKQ
jgi:hypothetical protein